MAAQVALRRQQEQEEELGLVVPDVVVAEPPPPGPPSISGQAGDQRSERTISPSQHSNDSADSGLMMSARSPLPHHGLSASQSALEVVTTANRPTTFGDPSLIHRSLSHPPGQSMGPGSSSSSFSVMSRFVASSGGPNGSNGGGPLSFADAHNPFHDGDSQCKLCL